jgi:hypothetical protein
MAGLGAEYTASYNTALKQNQSMYDSILAGYKGTQARQMSAQEAIKGGYTGLYNDVLGQLAGQGQEQRQQINDDYATAVGKGTQSLIDRGLGNSTIMSSVARGAEFDRARAGNDLSERLGRQNADYMSRLGLSALDYSNAANQQNTNLDLNQYNWMNTVTAKYPDANLYARLAEQQGMADEAARMRDEMRGGYAGNPPPSGTVSGTYGSPPRGGGGVIGIGAPREGFGAEANFPSSGGGGGYFSQLAEQMAGGYAPGGVGNGMTSSADAYAAYTDPNTLMGQSAYGGYGDMGLAAGGFWEQAAQSLMGDY